MKNILQYTCNWESDVYNVDGKILTDLHSVKIDGKIYPVTGKKIAIHYDDMGHNYQATSRHYFIDYDVFGVPMTMDINKIVKKVEIEAVKYETKRIKGK